MDGIEKKMNNRLKALLNKYDMEVLSAKVYVCTGQDFGELMAVYRFRTFRKKFNILRRLFSKQAKNPALIVRVKKIFENEDYNMQLMNNAGKHSVDFGNAPKEKNSKICSSKNTSYFGFGYKKEKIIDDVCVSTETSVTRMAAETNNDCDKCKDTETESNNQNIDSFTNSNENINVVVEKKLDSRTKDRDIPSKVRSLDESSMQSLTINRKHGKRRINKKINPTKSKSLHDNFQTNKSSSKHIKSKPNRKIIPTKAKSLNGPTMQPTQIDPKIMNTNRCGNCITGMNNQLRIIIIKEKERIKSNLEERILSAVSKLVYRRDLVNNFFYNTLKEVEDASKLDFKGHCCQPRGPYQHHKCDTMLCSRC